MNEDELMDIHKPKPIHNWRDFVKEVGTIVLGVCIALTAEQAVEKWREHRQHNETHEAIRTELGFDIFNISRRKIEVGACLRHRIGEIGGLLDMADQGKPFAPPSWIGDSTTYRMRFSAEQEVGRSGLFTPEEQQRFGALYGWLHDVVDDQERERQAWGQLQALEGQSRLSSELAAQMRVALAQARYLNNRIEMLIAFLNRGAQLYDVPLSNRSNILNAPPEVRPHCLPIDAPHDEAARRSLYPVQK